MSSARSLADIIVLGVQVRMNTRLHRPEVFFRLAGIFQELLRYILRNKVNRPARSPRGNFSLRRLGIPPTSLQASFLAQESLFRGTAPQVQHVPGFLPPLPTIRRAAGCHALHMKKT